MATHCSILAWKIAWTEEPGGLQSMGLQRVGHDWVTHTLRYKSAMFVIKAKMKVLLGIFLTKLMGLFILNNNSSRIFGCFG